MKPLFSLLAVLWLGACAGPPEALVVKQFQLRDQQRVKTEEPMVRMEKERHFHGAISMSERRARLGQYYTLIWQDKAGAGQGEVELVFQYQQGATASRVKQMSRKFPATDTKGSAEFAVIGNDYLQGGKVLAWKASLFRGKREISSRKSYLWQ